MTKTQTTTIKELSAESRKELLEYAEEHPKAKSFKRCFICGKWTHTGICKWHGDEGNGYDYYK